MPVVDAREIWSARTGEINKDAVRSYVRIFRVQTDDAHDGALVAETANIIPAIFNPYTDLNDNVDLDALAVKISSKNDADNPFFWDVTVEYSSDQIDVQQAQKLEEDPLSRPPVASWDFERFSQAVTKDVNGKATVTSAGEQFDPPLEKDKFRPVLTISRNEATFSAANALAYQDALNSDQFYGCSPGQAKMSSITGEYCFENNMFFWRVTYKVQFDSDGFALQVLDAGYAIKDGSGKPQRILDSNGNPPAAAVLLDGSGGQLAPNATPVYRSFDIYKSLPFAILDLPQIG